MVNYYAGSPALPVPGKQISDYLPASGSRKRTDSDFSLSPHLARFLARPVGRPRFRFMGSWIVGLAMGGAESRVADVAVGFSR